MAATTSESAMTDSPEKTVDNVASVKSRAKT
jgi:hypothetical protein